ncbi:MAG: serine hydrolase domain-containing protein [Runella sp.]
MLTTRRQFVQQLSLASVGLLLPASSFARLSNQLPRSTPESQGVDSGGIIRFLEALSQSKHEMHSLMILRHGQVIAEGWWQPYAPDLKHTLYSMSKSFTSTAIGLAVAEGKLQTSDKVISFFPDDLPPTISENLAKLSIKDLLMMSVGQAAEPKIRNESHWVRAFLATPIEHTPGSVFLYNSMATYMCSAILQKVTGQKLIDYLRPRLFEPLDIQNPDWEEDSQGINTGGWGLRVRTEDLAKFGQLYLQKGLWKGHQIIPKEWVEEATTFKIQQPPAANATRPTAQNDWQQGYCYQFWRCQHNAYRGDGAFGQYTIVMPDQEAVIAITSETPDMQGILDLIWTHLLPAMKPKPLSPSPTSKRLKQILSGLALLPPKGDSISPKTNDILGKTYQIAPNDLHLQSLRLTEPVANRYELVLQYSDKIQTIPYEMGKWGLGQTTSLAPTLVASTQIKRPVGGKIASSGLWKTPNMLEITIRYYESPHREWLTLTFDNDQVEVSFDNSISRMWGNKDARPSLKGIWVAAR